MKSHLSVCGVLALLCCPAGIARAGEATWTGAGTDAKWETAENWANNHVPANGDTLVLPAVTNTNARNGTPNLALGGITINADAPSYQLNGKPIKLKGDIVNNSKNPQSLNLYITLMGNRTITTAGDLSLGGVIRGEHFGITKTGEGQLALTNATDYTGPTTVHGGTLLLGNAKALSASSILVLDGAKLVFGETPSLTLGPLEVKSASIIDFGASSHAVTLADSKALPWTGTLSIYNWDGDAKISNSLTFGTDNTSLTEAQLKAISFYRDAGKTLLGHGAWASNKGQLTFAK